MGPAETFTVMDIFGAIAVIGVIVAGICIALNIALKISTHCGDD